MKHLAPWWFWAIVLAFALPVFSFSAILSQAGPASELRYIMWFYPLYLVASAVCSLICYRDRREVAWIIVVLMALSDAAVWYLGTGYGL